MVDLPERKAGIVACSCEELPEGTVARLAALKVLHELRPGKTVTICLPLFLAGGKGDRAFARAHPTITVDGCGKRCAARGTERYSAKPYASLVVNDLLAEKGLVAPTGRHASDEASRRAVDVTAERLATLVDEALAGKPASTLPASSPAAGTCSCGSNLPTTHVAVEGVPVEMFALPLIFKQFREAGRSPDDATAGELLEAVRVYNALPPAPDAALRETLRREFEAFCRRGGP